MAELTGEAHSASMAVSESVEVDGTVVLALSGEMDLSTVSALHEAVQDAISRKPRTLAFDLAGLTFMDSSGIAALLSAIGAVDTVQVRNPSGIVRRVIELSGLAQTFGLSSAAG
ncbi:MAG TPA: STAS domain-containing protein [Jatrophihabitantaceae bacterium]|jgi:anti-anti-sigma factor|nr:STAS domain-containing protein [Jatrophihabitantaceae bacterium]